MVTKKQVHDSPTGWVANHVREYVESDGNKGHIWRGVPTLLLTSKGRKSGKLRRTALIYGRDGKDYLLVASNGGSATHPSWYLNLEAEPEVEIQVGAEKMEGRARSANAKEKPRLWKIMTKIFPTYDRYQAKAKREIPLIIIETEKAKPDKQKKIGNGIHIMNKDELRSMQAPFKEQYKIDPGAAMITLRAKGALGEGVTCKVDTGRALVEAGLHPATGGNGLSVCSGDMLLEALVACAGVTLNAVATAIGIDIRDGTVSAEGNLDFRGTLGVAKDAPVGFQRIRLKFDLDTDASEEQLATLFRLTERYCVVYQSLSHSPEMKISHQVAAS